MEQQHFRKVRLLCSIADLFCHLTAGVHAMAAKTLVRKLYQSLQAFRADHRGNIAMTFALAAVPVITAVGAAVDYSRANVAKAVLHSALDAALLAGARDGSPNWASVASKVFASNLASRNFSVSTPSFSTPANSVYA